MSAGPPPRLQDALSAPQQKLFENARRAFEQGNWDYALTACETILAARPECLAARQLQRAALVKKIAPWPAWLRKARGGLSALLLAVSARRAKNPRGRLRLAERHLLRNPYDIAALALMGEAAAALGWADTSVFAYEAIREIEPRNRANLLALGEALLTDGRHTEALRAADALLVQNPVDGAAQALMRKASIAQTMEKGNWAAEGDFRSKLKKP